MLLIKNENLLITWCLKTYQQGRPKQFSAKERGGMSQGSSMVKSKFSFFNYLDDHQMAKTELRNTKLSFNLNGFQKCDSVV